MSRSLDVAEAEIADALRGAPFPELVQACSYRLSWDENLGSVVEIVIILRSEDWNEEAEEACDKARIIGWQALSAFEITPVFICRTAEEHRSFAQAERGIWTAVDTNVSC